jgi:sigma-B regulation protein RsbU (phosphoserine phosphatase)
VSDARETGGAIDPGGSSPSAPIDAEDLRGAFALLAEMTQDFTDTLDIERALERALSVIVAHLGAEAGSLWLVEENGEELSCRASVGPNPVTGMRMPVTQGILGLSVRENTCQKVLDVSRDPHFFRDVDEKSGFVTRSILCAPMSFGEKALGAIQLLNKQSRDNRFAESDIHPLQVMASSAALAITNARMAARLVEHERVRRELELAAEIQRNLLPAPRPAPFPIYGVNLPARTVSGDFFDILPLDDGRIGFCLGDVSGKGMNAALLMAKTASLYRCLAKSVENPGTLLERLNAEISETATRGMFVTMAAGVFDPASGIARLANAGHEPPLHHSRADEFRSFPAEAPPLGIVGTGEFPETEIPLDGGSLYLCSDGLTEACSESGDALGAEGLKGLISRFAGAPLAQRIDAMAADVGRLELRDDLTLLGVGDDPARTG